MKSKSSERVFFFTNSCCWKIQVNNKKERTIPRARPQREAWGAKQTRIQTETDGKRERERERGARTTQEDERDCRYILQTVAE